MGPTGIHFSGHGGPGRLLFEDDEGREAPVPVQEMVERLRQRLPGELPPFFYLASCHGNDPGRPEEGQAGPESSAARLHRGGVAQVVGYYGPIADELSTRAEVALYAAIAEGQTTRYAVRQARAALAAPSSDFDEKHRPVRQDGRETKDDDRTRNGAGSLGTARSSVTDSASHPFAWAQLVFYHRGVDYPLSVPARSGQRLWQDEPPQRVWQGVGDRRVLVTGFIGRRREQHRVRGWIREGRRVFVFQGLGGLGKSTLAFHVLPMLGEPRQICTLWCQEAAKQPNRAEALVEQLLEYCRKLFGADWEAVVQHVDRVAGGDPGERFGYFLATVLENVPRLVVYLDNMESLLVGPEESLGEAPPEPEAFAEWHSPALAAIWQVLTRFAHDGGKLYVVASCRYRHDDFRGALIPVSPLPDDALFRLMGWFPALRQLAGVTRARLVDRLDGHPRAVEFANDLVQDRVDRWEEDRGEWRPSGPSTPDTLHLEWDALVEPALPQVRAKLWDNLLLARIWDRVLDDRARRMLFRTTLLRRPWEWDLMGVLGEPDEPEAAAMATAERLRRTSLLEQMELFGRRPDGTIGTLLRHTVHAATAQFISARFGDDEPLRLASHRRVGEYLEAQAKISPYVEVGIEAGHHLFHAGEYDRACKLLRAASVWLQNRGRVREALQILKPVLAGTVRQTMDRQHVGRLLGTAGSGYLRLGQVDKAIGYHEQALVINREIGDRQGEGSALGNLEVAYLRLGQADKAIRYYEDALMIDREIGNRQGEGSNLGNLGLAYADLGQADKAIGYYERCLVIHREIGDRQGEANALGNLGIAYAHLGQSEKAIGCYEQALDIGREIKDPRIIEFASRQLERLRRGPPAIP